MAKGTKMAGTMAGKMKAASAALKGERGIFRQLKEEHGQVSTLMNRCAATNDPGTRRELFAEIRKQLIAHAKGEEREFYPVFRQFEETSDIVEEAIEDHGAIDEILEQLHAIGTDSEEWADLFDELLTEVQDHVAQEENELFPLCEKLIDDDQAKQIESRYMHNREQILRRVA